jgi:hypothetical protein
MDTLALFRKLKPKTPLEWALTAFLGVVVGLLVHAITSVADHGSHAPAPVININVNQSVQPQAALPPK